MLLEVLTRTMGNRPSLLRRNQESLRSHLHGARWAQTVLVDTECEGVGASHRLFAWHTPRAEWVWILDDDDECTHPLLADLERITTERPGVGVVMVRMDHGAELGILPDALVWGQRPVCGHLGISSYIVKRGLWMAHRGAWLSLRYSSDFDFIDSVFAARPAVIWHDVIASRTQRGRSMGAAE